jgi:hypothetical protein
MDQGRVQTFTFSDGEIVEVVVADATRRAPDGLLDIKTLRELNIGPRKEYAKKAGAMSRVNLLSALEATDEQYLAWAARRLKAADGSRRLRFRLLVLGALRCLGCLDDDEEEEP